MASVATLSPREIECLSLVAEGLQSKEIAARLDIASDTVDGYIKTACRKLGAANRREAARLFVATRRLGDQPSGVAETQVDTVIKAASEADVVAQVLGEAVTPFRHEPVAPLPVLGQPEDRDHDLTPSLLPLLTTGLKFAFVLFAVLLLAMVVMDFLNRNGRPLLPYITPN